MQVAPLRPTGSSPFAWLLVRALLQHSMVDQTAEAAATRKTSQWHPWHRAWARWFAARLTLSDAWWCMFARRGGRG